MRIFFLLLNDLFISGTLTFHVRRRPADYQPRKRKKKPKPTKDDPNYNDNPSEKLPYLLELNPGYNIFIIHCVNFYLYA